MAEREPGNTRPLEPSIVTEPQPRMTCSFSARPRYARVDRLWRDDSWVTDALIAYTDRSLRPAAEAEPERGAVGRLRATIIPPVTDCHVHVGLCALRTGPSRTLARVIDLGWDPGAIADHARRAREERASTEVRFAGAFLTAPGGYPSDRSWAPEGAAVAVASAPFADAAVAAQRTAGAQLIKVALNAVAGPVPDDSTLRAIVRAAGRRSMPVVAHVEGPGQAARAWRSGVDVLAHTPWTERLDDELIERMAERMVWISTLDMHGRGSYGDDFDTARDNLMRFIVAGGTVAYGTDMGNDLETSDVNGRELAALRDAGLSADATLTAITGAGMLPVWSRTISLLPDHVDDAADAVASLPRARSVHVSRIPEYLE